MIPVNLQPEPSDFIDRVRTVGMHFLEDSPRPSSWVGKEYWRRVLPDMRIAYDSICAYSAHWIPHSTGSHSVDHFIPKSIKPKLAYEWNNFRYVSARFNSRKGTNSILDPFEIKPDSFIIDFKSFLIHPGPNLSSHEQVMALETIKWLKLNSDEDLIIERQTWFMEYLAGEISFEHLRKMAPFIAHEILRQNLSGLQES